MWTVPEIERFYISCGLFGLIPDVDSSCSIIQVVFISHILIGCSFKSVYFLELLCDGAVNSVAVRNCYIY